MDKLKRYFIGNAAPILAIENSPLFHWKPLRCFTGNSGGYYWLHWRFTWRKPFAQCWKFNDTRKQWEIQHD